MNIQNEIGGRFWRHKKWIMDLRRLRGDCELDKVVRKRISSVYNLK